MTQKILRGGMIGAGAWSDVQLAAWSGVANARIVALCDRHPDRRDPLALRYGIPAVYDGVEAMLQSENLDFVDICTRPYSHAGLVRIAAGHGLPVLCQKPFCQSLDEAQELVDFCDRVGVRLMINENYRWQPWFQQLRSLLDGGAVGEPFLARIHRRVRFTLPVFAHAQAYLAEMPKLAMFENGVHYLDTLRFLFGEPHALYARSHRVSTEVLGEDVFVLVLSYPRLTATVTSSWASVQVPGLDTPAGDRDLGVPWVEIEGAAGTLSLGGSGLLRLVTDGGEQEWRYGAGGPAASRVVAQQHFIDCLEGGAEFQTGGRDTLRTMALVYAAYRSAETGQVVDVTPAAN